MTYPPPDDLNDLRVLTDDAPTDAAELDAAMWRQRRDGGHVTKSNQRRRQRVYAPNRQPDPPADFHGSMPHDTNGDVK